ncbi:Hypothetical predicted protein [Olea europaea subsp. europaea]|uniref:Uncharacterized protein n=1 Tax=Olea europaea subsp. europaea TaxID=158383 RepID=A0A8S0VAG5_OLEEU|nr:Hypothetical predicted protein [Olea europaea subsp. europaea]
MQICSFIDARTEGRTCENVNALGGLFFLSSLLLSYDPTTSVLRELLVDHILRALLEPISGVFLAALAFGQAGFTE